MGAVSRIAHFPKTGRLCLATPEPPCGGGQGGSGEAVGRSGVMLARLRSRCPKGLMSWKWHRVTLTLTSGGVGAACALTVV